MRLDIIQGDTYRRLIWLDKDPDDIFQSVSLYVVSGNPYIIPLELVDEEENIWQLVIPSEITSNMFVGDFRCYIRVELTNTLVHIYDDINTIRVCYKNNKEGN